MRVQVLPGEEDIRIDASGFLNATFQFDLPIFVDVRRAAPSEATCNTVNETQLLTLLPRNPVDMSHRCVRNYGATGDATIDTDAIQEAIDACVADGGGTVEIPAGEYVSGPLFLRSNVTVHLESGATLLGSEAIEEYPVVDGRWNGIELDVYASLFTGHDLENVAITGRGTIDARGQCWWDAVGHDHQLFDERGFDRMDCFPAPPEANLAHPRPNVIHLHNCEDVLIRGVEVRNSPFWAVHPTYCENVTIDDVTVRNPSDSPNTDGINPDSCRNVRISNCHIDVGDDCITIKSGFDEDGRRVGEPCENVVITNCTMEHGHGGIVIGSEMSGDVRNVVVSNCVFDGTNNGLRIKTERGRGGVVENIRATNIVMNDLQHIAFLINMFYHGNEGGPYPVTDDTPILRNIHYSDITVNGTGAATAFRGLEEMPVRDISLSNVRVTGAERGFDARLIDGLTLDSVHVDATEIPPVTIEDATNVELEHVTGRSPTPGTPVVHLEDTDAIVRSCPESEQTASFLESSGDGDVIVVDS